MIFEFWKFRKFFCNQWAYLEGVCFLILCDLRPILGFWILRGNFWVWFFSFESCFGFRGGCFLTFFIWGFFYSQKLLSTNSDGGGKENVLLIVWLSDDKAKTAVVGSWQFAVRFLLAQEGELLLWLFHRSAIDFQLQSFKKDQKGV